MASSLMAAYAEQEMEVGEIPADKMSEGGQNSSNKEPRERRPKEHRDGRRDGSHRQNHGHNRSRDTREAGYRRSFRDNRGKNSKRDKRSRENKERH